MHSTCNLSPRLQFSFKLTTESTLTVQLINSTIYFVNAPIMGVKGGKGGFTTKLQGSFLDYMSSKEVIPDTPSMLFFKFTES